MESPIVSIEWLKNHLQDDDLIILHCFIKPIPENLVDIRIPGTRFFDLKDFFRDLENELPNSFPSPKKFQEGVRMLGINNDSKIVIYDAQGIYSSPRVYYLFKAMGHNDVAILDGGLPAWIADDGQTVDSVASEFKPGNFESKFNNRKYKKLTQIENNIKHKSFHVLDARSEGRFEGTEPEPRAGLQSGHIPSSKSLPFSEVLENGKFKSKEALKEIWEGLAIQDKPLVFSCGSGITACISMIAMELVSDQDTAVFDGSWTEWALAHQ